MKKILLASSVFWLSGCVVMTSKQFQKQQTLWQSIGTMSGYLECTQQLAASQARTLASIETENKIKKAEENLKKKKDDEDFDKLADKAAEETDTKLKPQLDKIIDKEKKDVKPSK